MTSKKTIKQRILEILLDCKPHHAEELWAVTHRFSDVIRRLRHEGYNIETLPLDGVNKPAWYQLVAVAAA